MKPFLVVRLKMCVNMALAGVIVAVLISLYHAHSYAVKECGGLQCLIVSAYGILQVEKVRSITPLVAWIAPQIVCIYMLGNLLSESIRQNAVYIFTRTKARKTWLFSQMLTLFFYIAIYTGVQFLVVLLAGYASGLVTGSDTHSAVLNALVLLVLQNFLFVATVNIISLFVSAIQSTVIFLSAHVGGIVLAWAIHEFTPEYSKAIAYFPFTQGIYSWHSDSLLMARSLFGEPFRLSDYSVVFSLGYMFVLTAAVVLLGAYQLEKMDLR
ncbi:hypothetical protein ACFSO0_01850 [Brevibacillus sp. GCM10020057]|uniref:hypothetical protein n=1 Tax=Brevibacillus sp. GCM10020057 TaxID=3317327 RepID=UPI00363DEFE9